MSIIGLDGKNAKGQREPTPEEIAEYQRQQKIVLEAPYYVCEECGGKNFMHIFRFKKVSRLLTGTGQDQLVQIPGAVCADCGTMPKQFLRNMEVVDDSEPENTPKKQDENSTEKSEEQNKSNIIDGNFK